MSINLIVYHTPNLEPDSRDLLSREHNISLKEITPANLNEIKSCEDLKVLLLDDEKVFLYLKEPIEEYKLLKAIKSGFRYLLSGLECKRLQSEVDYQTRELSSLNEIGMALSLEQDYDKLLDLILSKSREVTNCDAGSLYLLEKSNDAGNRLIFKLVQNDTLANLEYEEYSLPITRTSLAELVDRTSSGIYRDIHFTSDQLKEIRYAGLLHDFGKVGVRENVLIKAKKLYPHDIQYIRSRFDFIKKSIECKYLEKKLSVIYDKNINNYQKYFDEIDKELNEELAKVDAYLKEIEEANIPTVLEDELFDEIASIAGKVYQNYDGKDRHYLTPNELNLLSIKKGTLDEIERVEIESHVVHSYEFLKKIPWTKELENIPNIAYTHHEKINGSGYPLGIRGEKIPVQSKMMAVADIYDALTARDRPYKKAVRHERALDIIGYEVKGNLVDSDLFDMFVKGNVYELVHEEG